MKKSISFLLCTLFYVCSFSQTFNSQRLDSLFDTLEKKQKFMGSIAISQDGQLIYTRAIGYRDQENSEKATSDTKYRIGSISKMFTACLILQAVDEKRISLKENIYAYFPKIKNAQKITLENLLNHRSGIADFTNNENYLSYNTQSKSKEEMIEIISDGGSDFEPNVKAAYSNSNYVLLSYILENVYKNDFSALLSKKIAQPLHLKNTYFGNKIDIQNQESFSYKFKDGWQKETETDMSIPMGAGGIISTPSDLALFIESLFSGKIITLKSLDLMKSVKEQYGRGLFEFRYFDKKSYGHTGAIDGFKSALEYFPEEKIAIALISNGSIYTNQDILSCAKSAWFGKPFEIPGFEKINVDTKILNSYSGIYSSADLPIKIVITQKERQLYAQATGQAILELEAAAPTIFKVEQAGIVLEFDYSEKQMMLKQGGSEFMFSRESH